MKRATLSAHLLFVLSCIVSPAQQAVQPGYIAPENNHIAAQKIVEGVLAQHKEIGIAAIHATKPGETVCKVIAINRQRIGRPSDDDDLQTLSTGVEQSHNLKAEGHFEVLSLLKDDSGHVIGLINLIFLFPVNTDVDGTPFIAQAKRIRDDLQPRLHSVADLFQPTN